MKNIDTTGILALEELYKTLLADGLKVSNHVHDLCELLMLYIQVSLHLQLCKTSCMQLAISNPGWRVIHKLKLAKFVSKLGEEWIFLTAEEAVNACVEPKKALMC